MGDNPLPNSFLKLVEVVGGVLVELTACPGRVAAAAAHKIIQRETMNRAMNTVPSIRQLFQLQTVSQIIHMQIKHVCHGLIVLIDPPTYTHTHSAQV